MLKGQKKNLTDSECNSMVQHLLLRCTKAVGAADEVAQFKTICRNVSQRKKSTCGRKRLHQDLPYRIQAIPQSRRYCFRSLAHALDMPKSTLHDYFKRGVFAKYSSVLKPALTESNKVCRLKCALDHVCDRDGAKFFDDMYDTVHVDEKWFFMTRLQKKVYGAIGEKITQRSCKSKHHLLKWFDGKLGTWHFTEIVQAQRRSSRRDAGTPVMKTVSVTRETYKTMLVDKVIPATGAKWPRGETKAVKIQQDNAQPHVRPNLNDLDLGFFRAIQALQAETHSSSLEEIVAATDAAWDVVSTKTLNKNFLTLQRCLQEVILNKESMEMSAFCTQKEALNIVDDTDADDNLAAAFGLVELTDE
ncbi:hypothetical protein H257_12039 [Aphanomyces astaci]|uniref:Uncharacterized protein n=1 Tax=Aphanomyces astaci TaxID=112090 RepID=W4G233_APHAT|nr:hypothetical protein H257_12039 [Aphanomyces astaci]ETV72993.1 hypothetical protein H257_12039 [Aphanomyces astaci]|eukprot:XP_009837442.1 hypothetical protein H257_12039 [Aphanomyces astaci]